MSCGYFLAGVVLVAAVFAEAFEALVLPRRVTRPYRFTRFYYRTGVACVAAAAGLLPAARRRQTVLSVFGPLSLLALFAVWAAGLVLGFGLLHHALAPRPGGLADSLYLSGATFTTLGYGDVTPAGPAGRAAAVAEAATGFGFFAVVIGYLPVLLPGVRPAGGVHRPARRPGRVAARRPAGCSCAPRPGRPAGPPWPGSWPRPSGGPPRCSKSHLSFPVLGYYRSQHDNQSWLAALTCALDAAPCC